MKNKVEYIFALVIILVMVTLGGCNENINDFRKNLASEAANGVYIDAKDRALNYIINHTVNSGSDTLIIKFPAHSTSPVLGPTKVEFYIDSELLSIYNKENGTNYVLLPEAGLTKKMTVYIPEGKTESEDSLSIAYTNPMGQLSGVAGDDKGQVEYLLPIRILKVSGLDADIKYSERASYVAITVKQEDGLRVSTAAATFQNTVFFNRFTKISGIPFTIGTRFLKANKTINAKMALNNDLIDAYNINNGTNYQPLTGKVEPIDLEISEGGRNSSGVLNYDGDITLLTHPSGYLLPLEIQSANMPIFQNENVFYVIINMESSTIEPHESITVSMKTGSAISSENASELGVLQADRAGYSVVVRNMATGLVQAPYSASYPHNNMITNGTGSTYFNPTTDISVNVIIDLGEDKEKITGFELNGYSGTANYFAKTYDVCYATNEMYKNKQEFWLGNIDNCLRYVYVKASEPFTARYIILRDVKPTLTTGTRYFGWSNFYLYCKCDC